MLRRTVLWIFDVCLKIPDFEYFTSRGAFMFDADVAARTRRVRSHFVEAIGRRDARRERGAGTAVESCTFNETTRPDSTDSKPSNAFARS
jgi:hypothetical protein